MAKQIVFTYEDKEYTLEFTRRTVKQMEDEGFVAQDIDRKPMTLLPALFAGAFKAHHRFVKQDVIDKIYAGMPHKDELIGKLAEINDIMNNSVTGWRAFSNPRYFRSPYGRQKGWERIQPDNRGGDFQELTPEEVEQLELPPEWLK